MLKQDQKPTPDTATIAAHLRHITRRWGELDQPVVLEVVFLTADDVAKVKNVARFSHDDVGIAMAADHVAAMNRYGVNAYAVVNPVDATHPLLPESRASKQDIVASFFHWADADSAEAAENIKNFVGPKCTFYVLTGTQPCVRPHVYWELDEPTRNLAAWEATQRAIAATLKTDRTVVDPPRIMRIGGSVNWPKPQKLAKGYAPEVTTLRVYDADERPPVESERMARAFAANPQAAAPLQQTTGAAGALFQIDTGEVHGKSTADYADILRRARTDGEKHGGVRDLTASLAGMGVSRAMTEAIVKEACPVWDKGVEALIDSAYEKYFRASTASEMAREWEEKQETTPFDLKGLSRAALTGTPPRRWLYGHKLIRGFCTVLGSPGGTGKSAYAAAIAADLATGTGTLHDRPHAKLKTWVYNLEDPLDETLRKFSALTIHRDLQDDDLARIMPMSGRDRALIIAQEIGRDVIVASPDVAAVIAEIKAKGIDVLVVDPFVRAHQLSENDNKHIDFVMDLFAKIAHEGDCAVLLVHHSRKGFVGGDADSFRGGSSMTSAARIALTLQTMTEEEAVAFGVPFTQRRSLVRIDNAKANLAPPPGTAEWMKLESVKLGNATPEYPDGDYVQVAVKWNPPDAWDGIGEHKALEILDKIKAGCVNEAGQSERFSARPQDKDRWVGNAILSSFTPGEKTVEQAKQIIRTWLEKGILADTEYYSETQRKKRRGIEVVSLPGPVMP